jgi:hypothetical protein
MTSNDLIVAAPWFIFAAALAAVCIRLLRSRRASRNQPGRSAPYSQIAPDRQLSAAPVLADPHWLHQVIANLLTNALKFTPAGGQVTITTRQDGPDAVLQITDTGVVHRRSLQLYSKSADPSAEPSQPRTDGRPNEESRARNGQSLFQGVPVRRS